MFEVTYYRLSSGREPVKDFIDELPIKLKARAIASLDLLKEEGSRLRPPDSKHMGGGLFELRIRFSDGQVRIFYFFCRGREIIVTNGFIKKSKKTPKGPLNVARKYKAEYESR
jgi:phage-related protein